jgi:hypothetical protein
MFGLGKKKQRLSFNDPRNLIGKRGLLLLQFYPIALVKFIFVELGIQLFVKKIIILNRDELVEVIILKVIRYRLNRLLKVFKIKSFL